MVSRSRLEVYTRERPVTGYNEALQAYRTVILLGERDEEELAAR